MNTHDGQFVYEVDDKLPKGAVGWTRCWLQSGAYATWLNPEDRERAKEDLRKIETVVNKIRTKKRATRVCDRLAISPCGLLRDTKTAIINTVYRDRWPLRKDK